MLVLTGATIWTAAARWAGGGCRPAVPHAADARVDQTMVDGQVVHRAPSSDGHPVRRVM